jgi:hypothetical protein
MAQPAALSGVEKAYPGRDGAMTSKAWPAAGLTSGSIRYRNSATELGKPWVISSGLAPGRPDLTCRKWMRWPSISVTNWGWELSRASAARQSYCVRQYPASSFR